MNYTMKFQIEHSKENVVQVQQTGSIEVLKSCYAGWFQLPHEAVMVFLWCCSFTEGKYM